MLRNIFSDVLEITAYTSVIITLVIIAGRFIKQRYGVKWRYLVWLIIAIRLIIPLNFTIPEHTLTIAEPDALVMLYPGESFDIEYGGEMYMENNPYNVVKPFYNFGYPSVNKLDGTETAVNRIYTMDVIAKIWLCGMILFLIYQSAAYVLFKRKLCRWRILIDGETRELFRQLKVDMNIKHDIRLYRCSEVDSPMLIGFIKSMILLPKNSLSQEQLELVLRHELIHYSRHDLWYKLMLTLANAVHWFNPLVYIMAKNANNDLELICDNIIISISDSAQVYADTMLTIMKNSRRFKPVLSTHFLGGRRAMKERFKTIFDKSTKKHGTVLLAAVLAVSLLGGIFVVCGTKTESSSIYGRDIAAELYNLHSPYIGDHINDGAILGKIPFSETDSYIKTELDTDYDDNGYGIIFTYQRPENDSFSRETFRNTHLIGAMEIFLSLVDNADYAGFVVLDADLTPYTEYTVTRDECIKNYGNMFTKASESLENFKVFYSHIAKNFSESYGNINDVIDEITIANMNYPDTAYETKNFCVHRLIKEEVKGRIHTAYASVACEQYRQVNDNFEKAFGYYGCVIIEFKQNDDGTFILNDFVAPEKHVLSSRFYPEDIYEEIEDAHLEYYEELRSEIDSQVSEYLEYKKSEKDLFIKQNSRDN